MKQRPSLTAYDESLTMSRRKLAQLRRTAEAAGWLDVATPATTAPVLLYASTTADPFLLLSSEPKPFRIPGGPESGPAHLG